MPSKEIVTYLTGRDDRFFSSLVVAAVGGSPKFYPVSIADDPQFEVFADEESIEQSFGVLRFSGAQDYYALDGQHRLKAIQTLLQPEDEPEGVDPPQGFENEEVSVLMVLRPETTSDDDWLQSYRRLFSSLNRYAKPTDQDTNIIMDEDDIFAILTRRLISTHSFFKSAGRHLESIRIQTKGKALRKGTSYFTSLQQLYLLNEKLLTTQIRVNTGWGLGPESERVDNLRNFLRFRPPEEYIDQLYEELQMYWDAIIVTISDMSTVVPSEGRNHQADGSSGETPDNALFWPIGQEVMIRIARALLDRQASPEVLSLEKAIDALKPLAKVDWGLHTVPWRGLLLVYASDSKKWSMRSEDRKIAVDTAVQLLRWITGISQLTEREEIITKEQWMARLGPLPETDDREKMWEEILNQCQFDSE